MNIYCHIPDNRHPLRQPFRSSLFSSYSGLDEPYPLYHVGY